MNYRCGVYDMIGSYAYNVCALLYIYHCTYVFNVTSKVEKEPKGHHGSQLCLCICKSNIFTLCAFFTLCASE